MLISSDICHRTCVLRGRDPTMETDTTNTMENRKQIVHGEEKNLKAKLKLLCEEERISKFKYRTIHSIFVELSYFIPLEFQFLFTL